MTEYLLERNHRATHGDPFLCEGVAEAMDSRSFYTAQVAVVPQGMIAAASGELVAIDGDEEPIFHGSLSVLQVLISSPFCHLSVDKCGQLFFVHINSVEK